MEFKIKAWAFTAEVENGDDLVDFDLADFDLVDLANRQLGDCDDVDSKFITSLRDDILLIKRLIWGAGMVIGSIIMVDRTRCLRLRGTTGAADE